MMEKTSQAGHLKQLFRKRESNHISVDRFLYV